MVERSNVGDAVGEKGHSRLWYASSMAVKGKYKVLILITSNMRQQDLVLGKKGRILERKSFFL